MSDAIIFDAVRTPRGDGRSEGALHEVPPVELATQILIALRDRNNLPTDYIEDVIFGITAAHGEQGCCLPRAAALNAGFNENVPGLQLSRFCSSGLEAVNTAAARIMSGQATALIAGGVESMSRVPAGSDGGAWTNDPAIAYRTCMVPQGVGADLIATLNGYSRADIDAYALESHLRAARAWKDGLFSRSIVPVVDDLGQTLLDRDEVVHGNTTIDDLTKLEPSFAGWSEKIGYDDIAIQKYPRVEAISHVHTTGNSSRFVDGAAGLLVASKETGEALGLKARARVRAFATVGSEPTIALTGSSAATSKALTLARMQIGDIDLFEVNESFASAVLYYIKKMNVPHDKVNVNGGAIAMGSPAGAVGAMILGTILDEMERTGMGTAAVAISASAGMGTATIIERI